MKSWMSKHCKTSPLNSNHGIVEEENIIQTEGVGEGASTMGFAQSDEAFDAERMNQLGMNAEELAEFDAVNKAKHEASMQEVMENQHPEQEDGNPCPPGTNPIPTWAGVQCK